MGIVITISRQLGSRGSYIGTEVAQRLGFRYLDREILSRAAANAGYPDERMVEALAEQERSRSFMFRVLETLGRMSPVPTAAKRDHARGAGLRRSDGLVG